MIKSSKQQEVFKTEQRPLSQRANVSKEKIAKKNFTKKKDMILCQLMEILRVK